MITTATIYPFKTSTYARAIYLYGTATFNSISTEYRVPVMQYAVNAFTQAQVDNALSSGYITQAEYDETMTYKQG